MFEISGHICFCISLWNYVHFEMYQEEVYHIANTLLFCFCECKWFDSGNVLVLVQYTTNIIYEGLRRICTLVYLGISSIPRWGNSGGIVVTLYHQV